MLTYPKTTAILVAGCRADFVQRFAVAWRAMGFSGPVLVPQELGLAVGDPAIESARFADQLKRADLFLFEFGLATQQIDDPVRVGREETATDRRQLKLVERLFRRAASTEADTRPKGRQMPRRFIGVNVIFNKYWPIFTDYVGANINPFCSQVLAGIPLAEPVTMKEKVILKFRKKAG